MIAQSIEEEGAKLASPLKGKDENGHSVTSTVGDSGNAVMRLKAVKEFGGGEGHHSGTWTMASWRRKLPSQVPRKAGSWPE